MKSGLSTVLQKRMLHNEACIWDQRGDSKDVDGRLTFGGVGFRGVWAYETWNGKAC